MPAVAVMPVGSPPRVRGKVTTFSGRHRLAGITPACAGKRRTTRTSGARYRDHPRVCGEKWMRSPVSGSSRGSPPRVRGKDCGHLYFLPPYGITPACAGKSRHRRGVALAHGDHPRVCGEKWGGVLKEAARKGSPPRVRGKDRAARHLCVLLRITPACAGKSAALVAWWKNNRDHPRVCGEKSNGSTPT